MEPKSSTRCQRTSICLLALALATGLGRVEASAADLTRPLAGPDLVFEEVDGLVAVEAEHFHRQSLSETRAWFVTTAESQAGIEPDGDPAHVAGASGGAYLEILPDTRRNHSEELIHLENFAPEPGKMAILHYRVHITNPGRYYVWVRAHSTGSEDNGIHVGLNGTWPETGARLQWCEGKHTWRWESKQRTEKVHCGEPHKIYLDIEEPGDHEIEFSMREDGFEFDKFLLTLDRDFTRPAGPGPDPKVKSGKLPEAFAFVPIAPEGEAADEAAPREPDGDGQVSVAGEMKQWHRITVTQEGPFAHELDTDPNPFTDYRMIVVFQHESRESRYEVQGYFAADGDAGNTSAQSGTKWRAHFTPDKPGKWLFQVRFYEGKNAALDLYRNDPPKAPFDAVGGLIEVGSSDKKGRDFRGQGRLAYVGKHHLQFAGSGDYFLKAGADAPETLLAYADFDGTVARKPNVPLKDWSPHAGDWRDGDPTWQDGKGKGLIGALNYLSGKGANAFSFLTYNAGGDGDNIWPFVSRDDTFHYDVSKLDQWGAVFDHATARGLYLHFKMQETEMDDNRHGEGDGSVPTSLDGGKLGPERRLYCRELVARFGHALALNWNLGEESTMSPEEVRDMAQFIRDLDPFDHHIVIHTYPGQQQQRYTPLIGDRSVLTGASLQNGWDQVHQRTLEWVKASAEAGKPWVVANDEQGPASCGAPPDPEYQEWDGKDDKGNVVHTLHDIRKYTLWANLMAGGAGVEYYFGYQLPENDLLCQDWRSRDATWDYSRIALEFFRRFDVPFWDMKNANALVGNPENTNDRYALAQAGEVYVIYLPNGGSAELDLAGTDGTFAVGWFNPREGGELVRGPIDTVDGGAKGSLGSSPDGNDWAILVRRVGG